MNLEPRLVIAGANLLTALVVIALAVPLIRGKVSPNRLYGVRLRKSFESEDAWYEVNRWGGIELIRWSWAVAAIGLVVLLLPEPGDAWIQIGLSAAPLLYMIGCWRIYRYTQRWRASAANRPSSRPGSP